MTAKIIDGKAIAEDLKREVRAGTDALAQGGGRRPGLAVVMVGATIGKDGVGGNNLQVGSHTEIHKNFRIGNDVAIGSDVVIEQTWPSGRG